MAEPIPAVRAATGGQAPAVRPNPVRTARVRYRPQTLLAIPIGALGSLAIHYFVPKEEPVPESNYYPTLLFGMLGFGVLLALLYPFSERVRKWMRHMCPILGV